MDSNPIFPCHLIKTPRLIKGSISLSIHHLPHSFVLAARFPLSARATTPFFDICFITGARQLQRRPRCRDRHGPLPSADLYFSLSVVPPAHLLAHLVTDVSFIPPLTSHADEYAIGIKLIYPCGPRARLCKFRFSSKTHVSFEA